MSVTDRAGAKPPTAGVDWASEDHAVAVVDADGEQLDRFTVTHSVKGLRGMVRRLTRAGVTRVGIERPDGPVVDALVQAGFTVFVIAPNQIKHLRGRYGSAGNKDDRFDAFVLADTVRTDQARLHRLTLDTPATVSLRMSCRARKDLIAARIALANQLRAHLQITLPGAIGLFRDIDSRISLAFLTRFPSQDKANWLSPVRLSTWLRSVGYNNAKTSTQLHARLTAAPAGTSGSEASARAGITLALVAALKTIIEQIRALDVQIAEQLAAHPDAAIFTSLPRSGTVRAARLLAEIGDARGRFPTPRSPDLFSRSRALHPPVRQSQGRHVPVGRRQTAARCRHRLRRRLSPRQPVGSRPLPTRPSPRPRPPPRRTDTRPRLAAHHLAMLAGPHALRHKQTRRPPNRSPCKGLTQGYSCRVPRAALRPLLPQTVCPK
jgi:transposase